MIERSDIAGRYSKAKALLICQAVRKSGNYAAFLKQYIGDEADNVARNALCGMTKVTDKEIQKLKPILSELIDHVMQTHNSSVKRVAMSIIDRIEITRADLRTDWLDFCLTHMADPAEPPAIQALCMKQAFRMGRFYPELAQEVRRTIEYMDADYFPPAVKSVIKNYLKFGHGNRRTGTNLSR